ncbi:M23 family metallopeptidase [Sphingomonas sp. TREG-RG-20F-R18-01]|uniref:M23 family metallopeptidase n=1 Tax=Sphingomonas sp. TREG-RG-20F-R18-01 TaxID=2914982 RepID=UPI001F5A743F|nr:M23 family metallopeptidase [Sphingomonas sp. TREG-RG-20F-R18-01]
MFLRNDHGSEDAGGTTALSFGRAMVPVVQPGTFDRLRAAAVEIDWVPDLGTRIGSRDWWRGTATCAALCATAIALAPPITHPVLGEAAAPLIGTDREEARAQMIAPLAWGADTGRHMASNDLVRPLTEAPERPIEQRTATVGHGDSLGDMLQRAGLSERDAQDTVALVATTVPLGDLKPGTQIPMTLGRRPNRNVARPLEALSLRARFDLELNLKRVGDRLVMDRQAIAIDTTPLRITGAVGSSLYRSARAAGVPIRAVETYIKAIASKVAIGQISSNDSYDIIVERQRAATGETQLGKLLFAGLDHGREKTQLVQWNDGTWYEASGQAERQGQFTMPVSMARVTSSFGMRFHPLLGFTRMHKGIDIGTAWGTPVHAPADGVIAFAGRSGGYGNFLKMAHGGSIVTCYGHLSRFAVRVGQHVARGDVIAYSGNSGMSTGPHLHWEVLRGGVAVNPRGFSFSSLATLSGEQLRAFRSRVSGLLAVKPGA